MIAVTLDLSKVDKDRIYTSTKTHKRYLSLILIDSPDRFGNDGQVLHSVSKEERLAGVKGSPCGNWRYLSTKKKAPAAGAEEREPFQGPL